MTDPHEPFLDENQNEMRSSSLAERPQRLPFNSLLGLSNGFGWFAKELQKTGGEFGAGAFFLMLEEDISLFPFLLTHLFDPAFQIGIAVLRQAQAHIAPVGGCGEGNLHAILRLGE